MRLPQSLNAHLDVELIQHYFLLKFVVFPRKVNSVSYFLSKPDETRWRKCHLFVKRRNGYGSQRAWEVRLNHESFKHRFDPNRYFSLIKSYDIKFVEINNWNDNQIANITRNVFRWNRFTLSTVPCWCEHSSSVPKFHSRLCYNQRVRGNSHL